MLRVESCPVPRVDFLLASAIEGHQLLARDGRLAHGTRRLVWMQLQPLLAPHTRVSKTALARERERADAFAAIDDGMCTL